MLRDLQISFYSIFLPTISLILSQQKRKRLLQCFNSFRILFIKYTKKTNRRHGITANDETFPKKLNKADAINNHLPLKRVNKTHTNESALLGSARKIVQN